MSVRIGHARIDENGKASGGALGDQTGKEVMISDWYNKPWLVVIRAKDSAVAEKIANAMEAACANNNIGYDQTNRTSLFTLAKANGWNIASVGKCETDCSALVAVCVNAAGISVSKDIYTGNEQAALQNTGKFVCYTTSDYCQKSDKLQRGDILLGSGHTCIVVQGAVSASSSSTSSTASSTSSTSSASVGTVVGTAVSKCAMNIRSGSGTGAPVLGSIKAGTTVQVLEVLTNGWLKIVWSKASCGYAYTSNYNGAYYTYTAKNGVVCTAVAKTTMNVRSGPSTSNSILGIVAVGCTAEVLEKLSSGWLKIVWKKASCGYAYVSNVNGAYFTYR